MEENLKSQQTSEMRRLLSFPQIYTVAQNGNPFSVPSVVEIGKHTSFVLRRLNVLPKNTGARTKALALHAGQDARWA